MTHEKALDLHPKVLQIEEISSQLIRFTDSNYLRKTPDWKMVDIHIKEAVKKYKSVDSTFEKTFSLELQLLNNSVDSSNISINFLGNNVEAQKLFFNKMTNQILIIENELINYCRSRISDGGDWFDSEGVLIGQNTNHLRKGDQLIISAGVGAYSSKANPEITIAGKKIHLTDGIAISKIKISDAPGKYNKTVRIDYIGKYKQPQSFKVNVEYTVDKD